MSLISLHNTFLHKNSTANNNIPLRISFGQKHNVSDSFEKRTSFFIDSSLREELSYIESSYKQIKDILDKKTGAGVKKLVSESGQFNTTDGLTFKNIGEYKNSVSVDVGSFKNLSGTVRITEKDRDGKLIQGWLLDNYRVVKNYNPYTPNSFPAKAEYYTTDELKDLQINNKILKLVREIDPILLNVRKLVLSQKDTDLQPVAGCISDENLSALANIRLLNSQALDICTNIPHSTLYKLNTKFPHYKPVSGQTLLNFQGLGEDNLQILYSEVDSKKFGLLQRLMVYDENGEVVTGYLIKDNNIVSNFNPSTPSILPEKLFFVDENEIKNKHYKDNLERDLKLYESALRSYIKHITPDNSPAKLSGEYKSLMDSIRLSYETIEKLFSEESSVKVNKLKTAYDDYVNMAGKRGYTFKNTAEENGTINIMRCKNKNCDNLIKITFMDKNGEIKDSLLVQNDMVVSNYNPLYPTIIPPVLKFYNKEELYNLHALEYLQPLNERLNDFAEYIKERKTLSIKRKNINDEKNTTECETKKVKADNEEKSADVISNYNKKAYNALVIDCKKKFKDAIDNMYNDKESFFAALEEIKKQTEEFFSNI